MAESVQANVLPRVAIITQGYFTGGGVPTVARWLEQGLRTSSRFDVEVFDLENNAGGANSRRILSPATWLRRSLEGPSRSGVRRWGANAVEIEVMRYRPRHELTQRLREFDLLQVVAGSPALGQALGQVGRPIVLQVATTVKWERESGLSGQAIPMRWWRRFMTTWTSRMERKALEVADAVVVENQQMFRHSEAYAQRSATRICPPGIDVSYFKPSANGWSESGYILSLCRLGDKRKGLERTVKAYAKILQSKPDAPKLVLAGRGDVQDTVRLLIKELGLEGQIEVWRDVHQDELPGVLGGASVFVQTSYEEGLGLSVVEAMAAGLPVVATETAGSLETIDHGTSGWIVSQTDDDQVAEDVADRVLDLLANSGADFGVAARARVLRRFDAVSNLDDFMDLYDRLLLADEQS